MLLKEHYVAPVSDQRAKLRRRWGWRQGRCERRLGCKCDCCTSQRTRENILEETYLLDMVKISFVCTFRPVDGTMIRQWSGGGGLFRHLVALT